MAVPEVEAEVEVEAVDVAAAVAVRRINLLTCLWTILIWTWITIMLKPSTLEFQAVELLRNCSGSGIKLVNISSISCTNWLFLWWLVSVLLFDA